MPEHLSPVASISCCSMFGCLFRDVHRFSSPPRHPSQRTSIEIFHPLITVSRSEFSGQFVAIRNIQVVNFAHRPRTLPGRGKLRMKTLRQIFACSRFPYQRYES